jgi:hypothetical protein
MGNRWFTPLKRGAKRQRNYAFTTFAMFAAAVTPLLWIGGCTGMVSGQNRTSAVQVAPASMNFGSTGVGKKLSQAASVTNNGETTVMLTKASLTSSEFSVSGLQFPLMIRPRQKANFTVWYKGTKPGRSKGMLQFDGGLGTQAPEPVELTGTAGNTGPQLGISASTHDFGKVTVNTSVSTALTLTNAGASSLRISHISVNGITFASIGITAPTTLTAGGTAVLDLTFSPKTAGNYLGSVAISSDDADMPTTVVNLRGEGTAVPIGKLTATPALLNFNNIKAGSSASASATLRNDGTANVTLSQINLTGTGFSASGVAAPLLIVPGEAVTLNVKFSPTAAGTSNGNIALVNSQGGATTVSLSGTSTTSAPASQLAVSPGSINFGNVVSGVTNTQPVQLTNSGSNSVKIASANVTGAGFSAVGLNLPVTLNPGQSTSFNVQFNPTTAAASTGSVVLGSDAANTPTTVALSGTGVAAAYTLSVSPSNVSFGNVTVGSTASRSVTVANTGNANVAISNVNLSGATFSLTGGSAVTLSPSQSTTLTVQFAPATSGAASSSISITSNATGSPASIPVSGTGAAPVQHTVALAWIASGPSAGYNIYRSGVSGGGYAKLNSTINTALNYRDSTVQSSQTYYYVTTAVDSVGNESVFSGEVSASIP